MKGLLLAAVSYIGFGLILAFPLILAVVVVVFGDSSPLEAIIMIGGGAFLSACQAAMASGWG